MSASGVLMLFALLAALVPPLHAFAPPSEPILGIEPARLQDLSPGSQSRLRRAKVWQDFVAGEGAGWQARFDELTGTPHRAWGPGIPLPGVHDAASAAKAVRAVLARNESLLGVPLSELRLRSSALAGETWVVEFDRLVGGVPIWRGGVTARVKFGKLVLLGVDTYPDAPVPEFAAVDADTAIATAIADGAAPAALHSDEQARLIYVPMPANGGVEWHLSWEVRTRTYDPPGKWVSFVDAHDGTLLTWWNDVRFLSGVIQGTHDTRTVDGSLSTSPMPYIDLSGSDGATTSADGSGAFTFSAASGTSTLTNDWLTVRNQGGAEGSLAVTTSSPTWTTASATQAEIDSYVFLHQIRDWALLFAPDAGIINDPLRSNVNISSSCNAYYDGDVNFYESGSGCNNTGRIADVNYHEWGHGLHYTVLAGGTFDGSLSEGVGDFASAVMTLDPVIAPYFVTDGSGIRRIDTDRVYPDDVVNEVHEDGLIFAGAVWDLLAALRTTYGESSDTKGTAWEVTSRLFVDGIRPGPTIPDAYDEFVVADDDDGDLSNGTPHLCEIVEAFAMHGLGPGGSAGLFALDHVAIGNQAARVAPRLTGSATNLAPACVDGSVTAVDAVYSTDGGATWETAALPVTSDGTFAGDLPAFSAGTVVQYYLTGQTSDGSELSLPAGGSIAPYTFYVGELVQLYCEPFDRSDGGYTHELLDGNDQEGADDWVYDVPNGMEGDPTSGYTGRQVWGNDHGGGRYNGAYQADITNRLTSVPIDVGDNTQVLVQYRRWLNVEDGIYDQASVYANDAVVWNNHSTSERIGDEHTQDEEWILHSLLVDVSGGVLELGWEISSDGGLEFGGWNIDDVCVYALSEAPVVTSVTDFTASDNVFGSVELRFTMPEGPASEAVVVRRTDRFPEARDDGDAVYSGTATAGDVVNASDPFVGEAYYAVFVGSGDAWSEGAIEGANADVGLGLGEEDPGIKIEGGCGCSTGAGAGRSWPAAVLLLAAVAAARRTRRA